LLEFPVESPFVRTDPLIIVKTSEFTNHREFWDRHPGLVWSNRNAPDDAFISAALRKGRFLQLLDIAVEFGIDRLKTAWKVELSCDDLSDATIKRTNEALNTLEEANDRAVTTRNGKSVEAA
jgi:hypothetical protein